jgi:hypothetical protein
MASKTMRYDLFHVMEETATYLVHIVPDVQELGRILP